VLGLKHSLHRGVKQAKGFYAMYAALIALAATIVLIPGSPLGLITVGVQVLAGVLLPSATVFLLLLCNDKEVLGPWVNGVKTNVAAGIVVAVLVMLSAILMISVVFGRVSIGQVLGIMAAAAIAAALAGCFLLMRAWLARARGIGGRESAAVPADCPEDRKKRRENWRMPPLAMLAPVPMSMARRVGMSAMYVYLGAAIILVIVRVAQLALGG
jgi:hypothetical protein